MNYTEEELVNYIFKNYYNLLTLQEKVAYKTIIGKEKIEYTNSEKMKQLIKNMFCSSEAEVLEMLKEGGKEFRKKVCNRIITEHPKEIELNLCPKCSALARTFTSKQCPKCFYSWHSEK